MKDRLQQYFDEAKTQSPILNKGEVEELISQKRVLIKTNKWFNIKSIFTMITLSACTVALFLFLSNNETPAGIQQVSQPLVIVDSNNANTTNNQEEITKPITSPERTALTSVEDATEPGTEPEKETKETSVLLQFVNPSPNFFTPEPGNREYFDADGNLILTYDELAELGIITDGNVLFYGNVIDTIEKGFNHKKGLSEIYCKYWTLSVEGAGFSSNQDYGPKDSLIKTGKPFWPALWTDEKHGHNDIEPLWSTLITNDFFNLAKPYLVPVLVETTGSFKGEIRNQKLIFWFKLQPEFINALPKALHQKMKEKASSYSMKVYENILDSFSRHGYYKRLNDRFNSDRDSIIKSAYKLTHQQQEKLNIKVKKGIAYYDNRFKINGKIQNVKIQVTQNSLFINSNAKPFKQWRLRKSDVPFIPFAIAPLKMNRNSYIYEEFDKDYPSGTYGKYHYDFLHKYKNLVPVIFGEHHIIWFENNEVLKSLISKNPTAKSYDKIEAFDIYQYNWARVKLNGKYGFINSNKQEIVPPVYDEIDAFDIYRDSWARVRLKGKYGFIDNTGKEIVKPVYTSIEAFGLIHDGWAEVEIDGKTTFIDNNGKLLEFAK